MLWDQTVTKSLHNSNSLKTPQICSQSHSESEKLFLIKQNNNFFTCKLSFDLQSGLMFLAKL